MPNIKKHAKKALTKCDLRSWLLLILILLVAGSVYIEVMRGNNLVLDYVRIRSLAEHQAQALTVMEKTIETQKELISALEEHIKEAHTPKTLAQSP